jgi:hypothetical protein
MLAGPREGFRHASKGADIFSTFPHHSCANFYQAENQTWYDYLVKRPVCQANQQPNRISATGLAICTAPVFPYFSGPFALRDFDLRAGVISLPGKSCNFYHPL